MGIKITQKVSRSGQAAIIIIPKKIRDMLNIEFGDYIQVDISQEVIKLKDNTEKTKEELVKKDILQENKDEIRAIEERLSKLPDIEEIE